MRRLPSWDWLAISFAAGCLPLLILPNLLTTNLWYSYAFLIICFSGLFFIKNRFLTLLRIYLTIFAIGFLWSTAYAKQYLTIITPYIDKTLSVTATVTDINTLIPESLSEDQSRYIKFKIDYIDGESLNLPISLFWNEAIQPLAGQVWHLQVQTKAVHSYLNEGGFDSQRFAMSNRTLLLGTVKKAELIKNDLSLRQKIVNRLLPHLSSFANGDIILALAFGDRSQLSRDKKLIMMQTGIAHLMAISGMHILLIFALGFSLAKTSLFLLPNRFIHHLFPIIIGWLCSLFYVWLSGINPPAMRAILALSIWIFLRYQNRLLSGWQKIVRIIALLLLFDPLMILSESFWLSCYVVMCLIFLFQWVPLSLFLPNVTYKKRWYFVRLLHLQLGLTLLLMPIQLFIFQGTSLVSIIANLLAIPVISFITFPAILIALLFSLIQCSTIAYWALLVADCSVNWLFISLDYINNFWFTFSYHFLWIALVGWLTIIIWRTGCWRRFYVTIVIIIALLLTPFFSTKEYNWRVDMLDVGHGLAIVIHNGESAILYDTGAKWEKSSAAERVIIPFLKWHGLRVEGVIISHQDNDHIGGLTVIQNYYPDAWLMSSSNQLPNDFECIAGNSIIWNQLTFNILWPDKLTDRAKNGDSCVIQISDGKFSILLTGDLEKKQEYLLTERYREQLSSQILQIPHHGSSTSSTYAFLSKVKPELSLASTSRYNPWKLPSKKALDHYRKLNLPYYVTANTGQITLFFSDSDWRVVNMRQELKPRWYHQWFGTLANYE
ncbi:DNA internalization-related competence protein ComEC/Rec2 [Orbaceae bacterium ESL0721]|nr:DNA internalization-related competence protein ComEC/Rec2 [Orbaceae bacterium ESL0721]